MQKSSPISKILLTNFKKAANILKHSQVEDFRQLIKFIYLYIKGWRFIILSNGRIGHQIVNTLSATYHVTPSIAHLNKICFVFPVESANSFLDELWKDFFLKKNYCIITSQLTFFILSQISKLHAFKDLREKNKFEGRRYTIGITGIYYIYGSYRFTSILHNFTDMGIITNNKYIPLLKKPDLQTNSESINHLVQQKYICTYTRDHEYLGQLNNYVNSTKHNYRNDDYLKLMPTVEFLNKKRLPVVRMGNCKVKIDNKYFSNNHIDFYDSTKDSSDDVKLCSNCLFYIGDTSGLANISALFRVPVVRYNWIPIFNSLPYRTLMIPMLYKDKSKEEFIPFRKIWEMKKKGLEIWHSALSLEEHGIEIVKNSSEEIKNVSIEMFERINDNYNFMEQHPFQNKFEKMMSECDCPNPGLIGMKFMDKYSDVFK